MDKTNNPEYARLLGDEETISLDLSLKSATLLKQLVSIATEALNKNIPELQKRYVLEQDSKVADKYATQLKYQQAIIDGSVILNKEINLIIIELTKPKKSKIIVP